MGDIKVGIKIEADGSRAVASLNQVGNATRGLGSSNSYASNELKRMTADLMRQSDAARQSAKAMAEAQAAAKTAASSFSGLGTAIGLVTSVMSGRELYGIIAEYDKLNASLKTVTGSSQAAVAVMDGLKQFARETPYELAQVTQAFIILKARGLDASMESLRSMGNTASAMSKPLLQFIEAVADAATFQFVRLEEFGINVQQQGDKVKFTFNGVETTIEKNSAAIQEYLMNLGRTQFSSGMVNQMNTVDGALSNVKDSFSQLVDTIGNLGVRDALKRGFAGVTEFLDQLRQDIESVHGMGTAGAKANLENQLAMYRNIVDRLSRGGADVTLGIGSTEAAQGRVKALEDAKAKMAELQKQLDALNGEMAKTAETAKNAARAIGGGGAGSSTPLGIASKYLGMSETNRAAELTEYLNKYSGTTSKSIAGTVNAWCARFVSAVLHESNLSAPKTASSLTYASYGKGVWQRGMSKDALADVQPGDIAVFTRKNGGHVGFVKAIDPTKGLLEILGGNQSNSVSVAKRSMQDLLAIRRPPTPGAKGEYEDFDKYAKRAKKEQEDAQREAEKRQREATQRYINGLDDQAKAAQRQSEITISGIDNQIAALDRERDTWNKSQDDKIDAAKGSYDEMARLEAERAAKMQEYAGRELALIQQQFDARKRAMEAAGAAYQKQLANPNLTDDEERRAKQGLADVQADLVKLANERAQAEAKAGQSAIDASRGSLELAQKQKDFIAGINADLEFQKQLYLQLKSAKEAGASAEGLAIIRATAERTGTLPGAVSQAELQRTEQAIAQTKIYEQSIADLTQTQQDRTESVREQQLRENSYWDQLINRMEQYADTWREITGVQNDAFSRLAIQTNQYAKSINQIGKAYEDMNKTQGDPAGVLGIAEGAAQAQAALNLMAQTMLALRSQYKEGTQGYEDMTAAAERMMEVQRALQLVEAVLGVVHQATSGDPYTAIPRMIGVAAMMASMGLQTGAGGSAKASVKYAAQPGQQDSGVFGDPSKASDSIAQSLAIIRDNSSNDLSYSAAMLRALEGIEAAMKGVTNTVIRGVSPASIAGLGSKVPEGLNTFNKVMNTLFFGPAGFFAADFLNKALAPLTKILFNVTRKISDFGIAASQQALSDILTKGFSGQVYTDIETTTKMLGITVSKSVKTAFSDLDPTIAREFTRAFESIRRAVIEGGKAFDLTAEDFNQRLRGFVVDMGKISTKDLTGEQLQEKITQMFSEQSDRIARRFMPKLGTFQQVGEGYFQTFIRVADAVIRAKGELERLGVKAIDFRDKAIDKQAPDLAAEIVRQSLLQQTRLGDGVKAYVAVLEGSATDVIDAYKKLQAVVQGLRTANLGVDVTQTEINAGGGLDAYVQNLQTYLDKFLTPGETLVGQWQNIGDAFTALGLKMPTTNAEFRAMVEGIDTTTEAGQKLRGAVLALAPGFADLTAAMDDAKSALQSAYDTAKQQAQGLRDYLNSLKTGESSTGTGLDRYSAAKKIYEETLAKAQAGDPAAIAALQGVSTTFLELSKKYFAASGQYATDLASVQTGLGGLADSIERDIKTAEDQYTWIKANTDALTTLADAMKAYETTMAKVNGIQSSQTGGSVNDANAANKAAAERQRVADLYEQQLNDMVRELRQAQKNGNKNKIRDIRNSIAWLEAQINASAQNLFAQWTGNRFDVQLRAQGGYTQPGWTIVGEQGPELVNFTRPSRVYTASETSAALAGSPALLDAAKAGIKVDQAGYQALLAELQAIRAEMSEQTRAEKMRAVA